MRAEEEHALSKDDSTDQGSPLALEAIEVILQNMGAPAEKSIEMAAQLDKRARQLAQLKSQPYHQSMAHLLHLMKQGWAAKEKGVQ